MDEDKGNNRSLDGYEGLRPLDKFGRFVMEHLRDDGIGFYEGLTRRHWKGEDLATLQSALQSFTDEQKEVVWLCVRKSFDKAIHTFLFKLQEQADFDNYIQILVDGKNIVEESEALHWELFGEDGWLAKYSIFGEPSEYQLDESEVEDTLNG